MKTIQQGDSGFSTVWKKVFHGVEKSGRFFHGMENFFMIFPRYGKKFSTVWKTAAGVALAVALGLALPGAAHAQQVGTSISADGAAPNANAMLDIPSPATGDGKGLLIPRVTQAQRTTADAAGRQRRPARGGGARTAGVSDGRRAGVLLQLFRHGDADVDARGKFPVRRFGADVGEAEHEQPCHHQCIGDRFQRI
jgi:hypothetical protein